MLKMKLFVNPGDFCFFIFVHLGISLWLCQYSKIEKKIVLRLKQNDKDFI